VCQGTRRRGATVSGNCDNIELGSGKRVTITINEQLYRCAVEEGGPAGIFSERDLTHEQQIAFLFDQLLDDHLHRCICDRQKENEQ
jgi:hypothetical protein